ncbi:THUMP domain-containing protein [Thermococcus waiotapuensis]|uniref:THUMP domain-containing protein n=1 Tax=Thermococcus waiotapuensis TaxID=90909 RepID=A0AAE4NUC6_9EURY|nr:THUMP domain-containing protein [Thermococcus waiotapuensis]MDV3103780.1 THUMP domain-containing protein [Thermococcus waiotapuensis]
MVVLIVTCPPGREGDAILELEWALEKVHVRGTDWGGVLIAETPLSKDEVIKRLLSFETQALQRVTPLDYLLPAGIEEMEEKAVELMKGKTGTFAVRAKVRGNKKLGEKEIERALGSRIVKELDLRVDLSRPDWVVAVEVIGKKAGLGVLRGDEVLKFEVKD